MVAATPPDHDGLIAALRAIVGDRGLLTGGDVSARSCDPFRAVPPQGPAIVRPASTEEVARVLAWCHTHGQRVVLHGGCTGVVGGAYTEFDEIVLSLERIDRIEDIDPVGQSVVVGAGVTLERLQEAVAAHDLLYPIDLGAKGSATIGGTIATNAGGNRVVRWGMTRQNVLGLEAVLADGTIVPAMNRLVKNNSGYDIKQLFIGSEGTLGIITRAVLKLVPTPRSQQVAFLALPDFAAVLGLLAQARQLPPLSAFEVMWRDFYDLVANEDARRRPLPNVHPFYVLVEVMGYDEASDSALFQAFLEDALAAGSVVEAVIASSQRQIADLWHVREASDIIVREMSPFISFDVSIDVRRADPFVAAARAALVEAFPSVRTVTFGHLGDNNLHLGVHIGPDTIAQQIEIERCVYAVVRAYDGALTAEHGIGRFKRAFLPDHVSRGALATMQRIRDALDPERGLNRAVLF